MEPHRHEPPVPLAIALTFLVGVGVAVQAFCNGRLAKELGSLEIASLANMVTGGALLVTLAAAGGALRRVREAPWLRWWMFVGGFSGALMVIVTTKAAPVIGVALMTVALVCGQSGGSLLVDRVGLSPAGQQPVSAPRMVGVGLAIAAVVVGGLSARTEPKPVLLALLVFAGFCFAGQQAVNARLGRTTGQPLAAATVNFAVGGAVLTAVTLLVVGGGPAGGWGAPPLDWIGGLLGAAFVIVSALVVPVIGVLRLTLAAVAGQSAGALVLDVVAPAPGEAVTVGTMVGVWLALAAVAVSGRSSVLPGWLRRRQTAAG
jgi:bacterial/archaeal transporter family-2 protein